MKKVSKALLLRDLFQRFAMDYKELKTLIIVKILCIICKLFCFYNDCNCVLYYIKRIGNSLIS